MVLEPSWRLAPTMASAFKKATPDKEFFTPEWMADYRECRTKADGRQCPTKLPSGSRMDERQLTAIVPFIGN
jgi:hypothetical protein